MNIIPREDDSIILVEKANIAICAVQKENFDIEEILAQLQISVAYFCSIGLYFLV